MAATADLPTALRDGSRELLFAAFDDMADDDWEHCLGGLHAVVVEDHRVLAHAALVQRRLLHGGRALRAGYVEGVAVRADRRGRGHGAAVMTALERHVAGGYELGALGSTDEALTFYAGRGWQAWRGPLRALTPSGIVDTPEERGGVLVLAASAQVDLDGELVCDWRDGDLW